MPITRFALLAPLLFAAVSFAADPRVGDAGAKPDPARFDPAWPHMKEWAEAGVAGGIPARKSLKIVKSLKPGDAIQTALDETGKSAEGGVVQLAAGTYEVAKAINVPSNVVLRGENKEMVVILAKPAVKEAMLKQGFMAKGSTPEALAAHMKEQLGIWKTALKVAHDLRRKVRLESARFGGDPADGLADPAPDPEQAATARGLREAFDRVLGAMTLELSTVLVLFELEGLSSPEIAELLGVPVGTVASRLRRAREQFRAHAADLHRTPSERGPT